MTFLFSTRRSTLNRQIIGRLADAVVAAARHPAFYLAGGVADTFEGRFELLVLHGALLVRRLRSLPDPGSRVAQDLTDELFARLDPALRELGVGDMAVPKRMKTLAEAFLGRAVAYGAALDVAPATGTDPLAEVLYRNVYGGARPAADLAGYCRRLAAGLDARDLEIITRDGPAFVDPTPSLVASDS